jgi:hypothetical protein
VIYEGLDHKMFLGEAFGMLPVVPGKNLFGQLVMIHIAPDYLSKDNTTLHNGVAR